MYIYIYLNNVKLGFFKKREFLKIITVEMNHVPCSKRICFTWQYAGIKRIRCGSGGRYAVGVGVAAERPQHHRVRVHLVWVQQVTLRNQSHHLIQGDAQRLVDPGQANQHFSPLVVVAAKEPSKFSTNSLLVQYEIADGC